jgi:hypothetical protein
MSPEAQQERKHLQISGFLAIVASFRAVLLGRNPVLFTNWAQKGWIPAKKQPVMTVDAKDRVLVIPAKAGIQSFLKLRVPTY